MTLADAVAANLPYLRAEAESLMLDTFTTYAPAGGTKDADGMEVPAYDPRGTTVGKIQGRGGSSGSDSATRTVDVGGVKRPVVEGGLHVPADAPAPAYGPVGHGWEYVLTSLGPNTPADLLNSRWLVVDAPSKSHMTARRLDVVRLS